MSQEDLLYIYILIAPAVSIVAGIVIFFTETTAFLPAKKMAAGAAKISSFVFSLLACRLIHDSKPVSLSRSFLWLETDNSKIELFFNADSLCLEIVLFLSVISLCAFAFNVSEAKFSEKISIGRLLALSCISEGCLYAALLSGTLLQSCIFFMSSSLVGSLIILSRAMSSRDANKINLMILSNIAADYMMIVGSAMLVDLSHTSSAGNLGIIFYSASNSLELILAGCLIKAGIFPFCFIFLFQNENDFKYSAKSVILGNIISSLYIIYSINPLIYIIHPTYKIVFEFAAALSIICFAIAILRRKNIFMHSSLIGLCIAHASLCSIIENQQSEFFIFSSISALSVIMIFPHTISTRVYDQNLDDINYKDNPIFSSAYIFLIFLALGLPPFSGFIRNSSLCSIPFSVNGIIFAIAFFIMAFSYIRLIKNIIKVWKRGESSYKKNITSLEYGASVCLIAYAIVIEVNNSGFVFGRVDILHSLISLVPVFLGILIGVVPETLYIQILRIFRRKAND